MVLAAVLWSSSGFFAQAPWFEAWPKEDRGIMLAFWRSFFALLILLPFIRKPRLQWQIIPMAVCFAVMVWSFLSSMVSGSAASTIWLQYLSPAWVMLGGVFLGERITRADAGMFACCISGVLLILGMEIGWLGDDSSQIKSTLLGILSGVTFAGVVLSMRAMRDADSAWLISICHGATVLILTPWAIGIMVDIPITSVPVGSYLALAFFGVFQMSVPYLIFVRGLRSISSPEASVLALAEPVLVPIWVWIAWRSHPSYIAPSWWTWAGAGLILAGLLWRYLPLLSRAATRKSVQANS